VPGGAGVAGAPVGEGGRGGRGGGAGGDESGFLPKTGDKLAPRHGGGIGAVRERGGCGGGESPRRRPRPPRAQKNGQSALSGGRMQTAWSPVGRDAGNSTPRWESQPPSRSLHTPAPGRQNKRCCWRDRRVSGRRTRPMDQPIAQVKPPWDEKGVHFPLRHTLRPPHAPVASRLFPPLPRLPPLAQRSIPHDPRHEPPEHHIEPRMLPSRTGGSPEVAWARGHNKNARWANARAFPRPCSLRTAGARILSAAHPLAWPLAPSGVAGM